MTHRVGVMLPRDLPPEQVTTFARRAQALGFASLWVVEDLGFRGGVAQAATALAVTDRLTVGIGILPAAVRNPVFAAMEIATLAQLSGGRVDVGIGHGMPGWLRSVGQWPAEPLRLLEEHVAVVRALLRGESVQTAPGASLTVDGVRLEPAVLPDDVPDLLLGVRGPRSLALSGRIADGTVLAEPCTPEYVRAALGQVAATRPHRLVAYNETSVADDEQTALDAVRPGLKWVGEPDWAPHLRPVPFGEELAALRRECTTREEFAARLPDAWVRDLSLAGTPEQVSARLAELGAAGVTDTVLIQVDADPLGALDGLARVL